MCVRVCVSECVCNHKYISAHGWMGDLHGDLFAWIKCQFWKCVVIPELLRERKCKSRRDRQAHLRGVCAQACVCVITVIVMHIVYLYTVASYMLTYIFRIKEIMFVGSLACVVLFH